MAQSDEAAESLVARRAAASVLSIAAPVRRGRMLADHRDRLVADAGCFVTIRAAGGGRWPGVPVRRIGLRAGGERRVTKGRRRAQRQHPTSVNSSTSLKRWRSPRRPGALVLRARGRGEHQRLRCGLSRRMRSSQSHAALDHHATSFGVMAHEFSHVLNGDMRLNLRLVAVVAGLMGIAPIGRTIINVATHLRPAKTAPRRLAPRVLAYCDCGVSRGSLWSPFKRR